MPHFAMLRQWRARLMAEFCELRNLALEHGYGPCGGGLNHHHIISRALLKKNKAGRKLVDGPLSDYFIADVCNYHDAQTRFAHTTLAKEYLMQKRHRQYGDAFAAACRQLAATFVIPPSILRPYL